MGAVEGDGRVGLGVRRRREAGSVESTDHIIGDPEVAGRVERDPLRRREASDDDRRSDLAVGGELARGEARDLPLTRQADPEVTGRVERDRVLAREAARPSHLDLAIGHLVARRAEAGGR